MSVQTAIAAVYGLLQTVPGVGPNVYDQIRFSNNDEQFNALFVDATTNPAAPVVRTWMVHRDDTPAKDETLQAVSRTHNIAMTGYFGFQDGASSPIWEAQLEAICAAFLPYSVRHFNGQFDWSGPPRVEGNKFVFFGSVLCHTARIIHPVREFPLN